MTQTWADTTSAPGSTWENLGEPAPQIKSELSVKVNVRVKTSSVNGLVVDTL